MKAFIDYEQGEVVFGGLLRAYKRKVFPYDVVDLPQDLIPDAIKHDPLTHACFLFGVCHYMRGGIKSSLAVRQLVKLWEYDPRFFQPWYAETLNSAVFRNILEGFIMYKADEVSKAWPENSARLVKFWDGDPRNIFDEVKNNPSILYRLVTNKKARGKKPKEEKGWGFICFQEKMASMLTYFLLDAGLIERITIVPPVDFHLLRLMIATGVLKVAEGGSRYEHMAPLGIKVLQEYCDKYDIDTVTSGNTLWPLSEGLCSKTPGNETVKADRDKGNAKPLKIVWENPNHYARFMRSCGSCPIEGLCKFNIPSGISYKGAGLRVIPRLNPYNTVTQPLFGDLLLQRAPPLPKGNGNVSNGPSVHVVTTPLFGVLPEKRKPMLG